MRPVSLLDPLLQRITCPELMHVLRCACTCAASPGCKSWRRLHLATAVPIAIDYAASSIHHALLYFSPRRPYGRAHDWDGRP